MGDRNMRLLLLLSAATAMAAPAVQVNNVPLSFEPDTNPSYLIIDVFGYFAP